MPSFNSFDLVIYICLVLALIIGFSSGLLRSLATILGYLAASAVVVMFGSWAVQTAADRLHMPPAQNWIVLVALFVVAGIVLGAVFRFIVTEMSGQQIGPVDRLLGAVFGVVRILLTVVLIVVIFDRVIPTDRQPQFLTGSKLRPLLSEAGRQGLGTLPPDFENYIDRLKSERGI